MKTTKNSAAQDCLQISFLGGLTLKNKRGSITDEVNRSQKIWSVLCYLILHRNRNIPQTELIETFWGDEGGANPTSALKTLLHRTRSMLEPLFGAEVEPILSKRGAYCWNREIACTLDIDEFEKKCRMAEETEDPEQKLRCYEQALRLYQGDFLPKLGNQLWVVSISAHYHSLYLKTAQQCADLLGSQHRFEEMEAVCEKALALDPMEEELHIRMIKALLGQSKDHAARSHYEAATDLMYRNLGISPGEEMRELYRSIMAMEHAQETDLEQIQSDLKESAQRPGAFLCEYGFFREMYRLEARRAERSGVSTHVALLTLALPSGKQPGVTVLSGAMDLLEASLLESLRRGDVIARYSAVQYVVMLPGANYEDSTMVIERVVARFKKAHKFGFLRLSYKIRQLGG